MNMTWTLMARTLQTTVADGHLHKTQMVCVGSKIEVKSHRANGEEMKK